MLATSRLPIQTIKIFHVFLTCTCVPHSEKGSSTAGFQGVFEALFLAIYRTFAMNKFSIKMLLWHAVVWQLMYVTCPSDLCLAHWSVNAECVRSAQCLVLCLVMVSWAACAGRRGESHWVAFHVTCTRSRYHRDEEGWSRQYPCTPSFVGNRVPHLSHTLDLSLPNAMHALEIPLLIYKSLVDVLERMLRRCVKFGRLKVSDHLPWCRDQRKTFLRLVDTLSQTSWYWWLDKVATSNRERIHLMLNCYFPGRHTRIHVWLLPSLWW